jgi:ribonuclease J
MTMSDTNPGQQDFWFLPLGGCGEIGMNLNLYGHAGQWLMVDCGVTFEKSASGMARNRVEMADPSFIANRHASLVGIIATHAHEDHIGALHHLWEQFRVPIYTTAFTRNVLLGKFRRAGVDAPIITVAPGEKLDLGAFRVTWIPITHSTPETNALLIETNAGSAVHTADWKLDSAPIAGDAINPKLYQQLGKSGLDAVICDSTNATKPGFSTSESELFEGLLTEVSASKGRVVVACFASNVARLQTLGNVAYVSGRHLGLLGRSIVRMVGYARAAGYLQTNFNLLDSFDLGYLLPEETLIIATGSQGEVGAALHRLANDDHPDVNLAADDHVIFSAKTIPGNELDVAALRRAFEARGIRVTHADDSSRVLHASGHPHEDELMQMYGWLRPRLAVPVHGERRHMQRNAQIAEKAGVPAQLVGENGDIFDLVGRAKYSKRVSAGRIWFDEESSKLKPVRA